MKPLYLLVGKSASGKTTIAEYLEKEKGMTSLQSYTTRPPRYEGEVGHTFISDEEYDILDNRIAEVEYNGYRYCSTQQQLDDAEVYVIDPLGVETLLERYDNQDRLVCIVFFSTDLRTRIERMRTRGDSSDDIITRLYNDDGYDWLHTIEDIYRYYRFDKRYNNRKLHLCNIDANQDFNHVKDEVLKIINFINNYIRRMIF